jgi:hypothetical protein
MRYDLIDVSLSGVYVSPDYVWERSFASSDCIGRQPSPRGSQQLPICTGLARSAHLSEKLQHIRLSCGSQLARFELIYARNHIHSTNHSARRIPLVRPDAITSVRCERLGPKDTRGNRAATSDSQAPTVRAMARRGSI